MYKPIFPGTYYFNEFTFTTLGRTGALGPTTDQRYAEATWPSSSFSIENGIQNWIVPESATYQITAGGARAGNPGRVVRGIVFLRKGSVLNMLVGQQPTPLTANVQDNVTVGGGGGTFVVANGTPLIVASGGDPSHAGDFLPSGTGGGFSGAGYYGNGYPTDPVFAFLFPTAYVNGGYGNKYFYGPSGITEEGGFGGGQAPIVVTVISEFTSGAGGYTGSPGDGTAGATCYADSSVQNFTDLGANSNAAGFVNVSLVVPPPIQQISTWDQNWVVHPSPFPYQTTWSAATYGNGTYVAVSKNGTYPVTYSADGINWVKDTQGASTAPWVSVTFGNGQFAAVSSNGLSMVSTNGVGWTVRAPPILNGTWSVVGYGNGLFIALNGSLTSTSPDGIDWTARVVPSGPWTSVAYGNGIFVAAGFYGPPSVITSPDGINWTAQTAPALHWRSITYGNGLFVAVATDSVMTSPDGINWAERLAPTGFWRSITYGNGLFVATTSWANPDIMVSTDGINWVDSYFQYYPGTQLLSIVYGNGLFVTVNYYGYPVILTSPDGINWTPQTAPDYGEYITYGTPGGNPLFVVVGRYSTIYTSSDTITWTSRTSPSGNWNSVTYGDGIFVATGSFGSIISYDGINWKYPVKEFSSITYGNGRFIATALPPLSRGVFYSTDGLVWNSPMVGANSDNWSAVTYGQGTFVAVSNQGTTGNVMYSTDGSTWSNVTTGTNQKSWTAIAYGDGQFIAIAPWDDDTSSNVMISSDGINWNNRYPINFTSNCISYGNGYFAVASSNSSVPNVALTTVETIMFNVWQYSSVPAASYTGITYGSTGFVAVSSTSFAIGFNPTIWVDPLQLNIQTKLFFNNIWNGLAYGNGAFVAVGQGRIQTTLDYGNNWSSFTVSNVSSITYSHDLETFVAISNTFTNGSYTSQDAIAWTQNNNLPNVPSASTAIAYGNGLYVAVLQGDSNVLYSHDGVYWSVTTSGTVASSWKSIIYTQEQFIVSSNDGSSMTSSNGIIWTYTGPRVFPSGQFNNISYANGLYFATSTYGPPWLITSADGNTWTVPTVPIGYLYEVAYGNGVFVAAGSYGVMTSPDAINWTARMPTEVYNVIYGNGIFVATTNEYIVTSPDGINWTLNTEFGASVISYGTPGGSPLFVAVRGNITWTSPNGINWTNHATPSGDWISIAYGNDLFVAGGFYGPPFIMTSPDGINWTIQSGLPGNWYSIAFGNGVFVAVSFFNPGGPYVMSSPDGINWTARAAGLGGWDDIAYGNGRFIAVRSYFNKAISSADGISWSYLPINIVFIAYGNDIFVGISTDGQLFNSKDGTTWNSGEQSESISGWKSVVYGNGYFMAVGTSETAVVYSTDGINWSTDITGSVTDNWNTVAFGNNVFLTLPASGATTMTAQIVETF